MGSLMTDRELGLDETAVIIRATDEIKKLRKQSHGWHVMYKDAVVEIAALDAENTALKLRIETLE